MRVLFALAVAAVLMSTVIAPVFAQVGEDSSTPPQGVSENNSK
jgi:hypothetical protein